MASCGGGFSLPSVLVYWDLQPGKLEDKGCLVFLFFSQSSQAWCFSHNRCQRMLLTKCLGVSVIWNAYRCLLFIFETQTALILTFCGFWIPFPALSSFQLITLMGRTPFLFWQLRWKKLKIQKDHKGQNFKKKNPLKSLKSYLKSSASNVPNLKFPILLKLKYSGSFSHPEDYKNHFPLDDSFSFVFQVYLKFYIGVNKNR